jgi:hypothetical protein
MEKAGDGLEAGSRERQKLDDQLTVEKVRLDTLNVDLASAEEKQRVAKRAGDAIYDAVFNLDFKNPHTVADNHGDPIELLAKLEQDERHVTSLRDQLKAILAEALLR